MGLTNWVLTIEYDGTRYFGFQRQRGQTTVQAVLEAALGQAIGEPVRLTAAGRTDTGVHAVGQVVNFLTEKTLSAERIIHGANYYLPKDVAVVAVRQAAPSFNARRSALSRQYRYRVLNRRAPSPLLRKTAYHVPYELDLSAMAQAAARFIGRHDFRGFAAVLPAERNSVRVVSEARFERQGDLIDFWVTANAFLPRQVRTMVGTLIEIGRHKKDAGVIDEVLETRDRRLAGNTAPPQGLCLMRVQYPEEI